MGQSGSISNSKAGREDARARLRGLKLEEVLGNDLILQQVTSTSTAAFKDYRFVPKGPRSEDEEVCRIAGIKFWHLGREVDLTSATAEFLSGDEEGEQQEDCAPVGLFTEEGDEHNWVSRDSGSLIIRFEQPTPVSEFAFRTHVTEGRGQDPIRFTLEGSKNGSTWLMLCDETRSDFPTPNGRGAWTKKLEVRDSTVAASHVELEATRNLATAADKRGVDDLVQWASGKPPSAPVEEAKSLMKFCKTLIVGEKQRRREALFSMVYAASEASFAQFKETQALRMKSSKNMVDKDLGAGIAALSAKCAVHMLLETQLSSGQSQLVLGMLNKHLSEGMATMQKLPPTPGEIPDALAAALTSASDICREAFISRSDLKNNTPYGQNLKCPEENLPQVAELLLRLALLRASFGDLLAVIRWLICHETIGDVTALWDIVETRSKLSPQLKMEVLSQGSWQEEGTLSASASCSAIRTKVQLTSAQINAAGDNGAYVEAWLVENSTSCRVGFMPGAAPKPDDVGAAFVAGKAYVAGEIKDLEDPSAQRSIVNGDVVGLWFRKGVGIEVFVNGARVGKLPKCDELDTGCSFVVAGLSKDARVVLNMGQEAFKFAPPSGAQPYATAADIISFDACRTQARAAASALAGGNVQRNESVAVALTLLEIAAEGLKTLPEEMPSSIETKVFETGHPYQNDMNETVKVEVPGALSMRMVFDSRCNTEENCDWLKFFADEGQSRQIGNQYHGTSTWRPLEVEGDTCWYLFHTDGSEVRWGFRFTVEAQMPETKNPNGLLIDPTDSTISMLVDLLSSPNVRKLPRATVAAISLLSRHLLWATNLAESTRNRAADAMLNLAREKSEIGTASAQAFGTAAEALFVLPIELLRTQLRIWKEPDVYHPDAVSIVTERFAASRSPFGSILDDPAGEDMLQQLLAVAADEVTRIGAQASGARLLWRVLSDGVSYLVALRSACPMEGWAVALRVIRQIFELGAATVAALATTPGVEPAKFLDVLLLPTLLGVAAIPSFKEAEWTQVVALMPPLGALVRQCRSMSTFVDLRAASVALLAKLGLSIIGEGSQPDGEDGVQEILLSPLLCMISKSALGSEAAGIPPGVAMVEQATGLKLRGADDVSDDVNPSLAEMVNTSARSEALVKAFNVAAKTGGRAFFPAKVQQLLFCVLVKQFNAQESLAFQLEAAAAGDVTPDKALVKLWQQARKLEPWLLSIKQRMVVAGRDASSVVQAIEQALQILMQCDREVNVDFLDDDGLEAMWERQRPFVAGVPPTATSPTASQASYSSKSPSVRWGSLTGELDALKRLQLLLQDVPAPGANVPAQQIKSFFEAKWFSNPNPIAALLAGIQAASIAVWRRAAGLTLLSWCTEECSDGKVDAWACGVVIDALAEANRKEVNFPRRCAEMSSVVALSAARQFAISALSKLAKVAADGRDHGNSLQVMALAGLAGPWRCDDQDMILTTDVLSTLRPFLPWAQDAVRVSDHHSYSAWLAFQSLVAVPRASEQDDAPLGPFSSALLTDLQEALLEAVTNAKTSDGGKTNNLSLLDVFDAKSKEKKTSDSDAPVGPTPHEVVCDLRNRLQAGEDFGGLESSEEDWQSWLGNLPGFLEMFRGGAQKVADLEMGESDNEPQNRTEWVNFDANGDGYIDIYEYLRALSQIAARHSDDDSLRHTPQRYPPGVLRFVGDVPIVPGAPGSNSPFDTIPLPSCVKNPSCALLKAIDGLLRAQRGCSFSTTDRFNEAMLMAATDPLEPPATAVLALRILRVTPPSGKALDQAALRLLQSLAAVEGGPLWARGGVRAVISQRAEVLRAWISASEAGCRAVSDSIVEAMKTHDLVAPWGGQTESVTAALFVVGGPPGLFLLAPALTDGENQCVVVDTAVGGVTWEFHMRTDSNGRDIECHDDTNVESLKRRCLEVNGVAFNTGGWIKKELLPRAEWCEAFSDDHEGLYVAKRDDDVAVLQEGASTVQDVETTSLQMLPKRCDTSKLTSELRCAIIDLALKQKTQEAWVLSAVMSQQDAVMRFLERKGFLEWLPMALEQKLTVLKRYTPTQRSSMSAAVRLEFPGKYKELLQGAKEALKDAAIPDVAEDPALDGDAVIPDVDEVPVVAAAVVRIAKCPQGHTLKSQQASGHSCDVCGRCGIYEEIWGCRQCNWDMCLNCFAEHSEEMEPDTSREEREKEKKKAGVAAVLRAARGLGDSSTFAERAETLAYQVPDLSELLPCARGLLSRSSPLRIARLHGAMSDDGGSPEEDKGMCGLIDSKPKQANKSEKASMKYLLWQARSQEKDLRELVREAAQWDQQVLASDICLAVVTHLAMPDVQLPASDQLPPGEQLARLCLTFERGLDSAPTRTKARTALMALAAKHPQMLKAVQEFAVAHLLGSLGLSPKPTTDGEQLVFESPHDYDNYMDTSENVEVAGATRYRITFDSNCTSEGGCDYLDFFDSNNSHLQRSEGSSWEDLVIEDSKFRFTWHTDSSCTMWGYRFTVTPEGMPEKKGQEEPPSQNDGLWLVEFLMDMVKTHGGNSQTLAESTLRSEFAALLLAHLARHSDERLITLLLQFIDASKQYNLAFDWVHARDALEAMTVAAQENGQQSALQRCVALRLALPDVKVSRASPRFCSTGPGVLLLDEEHVCTQRTRGHSFCFVKKAGPMKAVKITRLTAKEVWIGAVRAVKDKVNADHICMVRLKDEFTFTDEEGGSFEIPGNEAPEVKVLMDKGAQSVTFDGPGFTRTCKLPPAPDDGGKWRFAVKLCEFGSSTRVCPPGGVSDTQIQELRDTMDAVLAARGNGDLPDSFASEAFGEWWASRNQDETAGVPDEELEKLGETSDATNNFLVWGAGIAKYNGVYSVVVGEGRNGTTEYENAAGCKLCLELTGQSESWVLEDTYDSPVYACTCAYYDLFEDCDASEGGGLAKEFGPWFGLTDEAGNAPVVCTRNGPPAVKVVLECTPPRVSSMQEPPSEESDVGTMSATKVVEYSPSSESDKVTVIFIDVASSSTDGAYPMPMPMYTDSTSATPKEVAGAVTKVWPKKACIFVSKSEWTECEDPTLFFKGGENFNTVRLLNLQQETAGGPYAKLFPRLAVAAESVHPLPGGLKSSVLQVSVPEAIGMTLMFNLKCQLPPDTVMLVSLDEAGKRPASLERTGAVAGALVAGAAAANPQKAAQDAARGVLSVIKGTSFKVDASVCYLHFPAPRPVQWEPLQLPVPVVRESEHPYKSGTQTSSSVTIPGAESLRVEFHTSCCTETTYDMLKFFRGSEGDEDMLVASFSGPGPWDAFDMSGDTLWYSFSSDEGNEYWGFGFTVTAGGPGSGGVQPGVGLMEGIPKLFADGIQLGGDGTLLFVGNTAETDEQIRPEVAAECEITNFVVHEGNRYATLDNADPKADSEKASQTEWMAIPKGWALFKIHRTDVKPEEFPPFIHNFWKTDLLVVEDSDQAYAYGTKSFKPGEMHSSTSSALAKTTSRTGKRVVKPTVSLARVLIWRPDNEGFPELLREMSAEEREEAEKKLAEAGAQDDEQSLEPGYVMRHSNVALNWLRPGVLAGEITIDFMGAPIADGDIAVGVAISPSAGLMWPPDPNRGPKLEVKKEDPQEKGQKERYICPSCGGENMVEAGTLWEKCAHCGYAADGTEEPVPMTQDGAPAARCESTASLPVAVSEQANKVGYNDKDGDRVEFAIEDGKLIKYVNGNKHVGQDDSSGVVTSLTFQSGNPAEVRDQSGYGSDDFPWELVWTLKLMADAAGVPNDLPDRGAEEVVRNITDQRRLSTTSDRESAIFVPLEAQLQEATGPDPEAAMKQAEWLKQAWLWRCDGVPLVQGTRQKSDQAYTFGAGDVVGVVATVDGKCLKKIEFLRNGVSTCSQDVDLKIDGDETPPGFCELAEGSSLALCLAVRRSSVCASLLPTPQLLDQLPTESVEEAALSDSEKARATAVFTGLDMSGDGSLQREEITTALGGVRTELFQALDVSKDGKVSRDEWLLYCRRMAAAKGANGLGLFLEAFRKKLVHIGRTVVFPQAEAPAEVWGVQVTATPRELTTKGCLRAAKETSSEDWEKFHSLAVSGWTREVDSQMVAMLEWLAMRITSDDDETTSPKDLGTSDLPRMRAERRKAFPQLTEPEGRLAARFIILKQLNGWIKNRILPFCDLGDLRSCPFGRVVSDARDLLFGKLGTERFDQIVEETFTASEGQMQFNRQLQIDCKSANECDNAGDKMIFAQASKLAENMGDNVFRCRGGDYGRPINISYENEEGVDQGGLYRDFLDTCAQELMSPNLPLLIPTPNGQSNSGECREAWTLAPIPMTVAVKRMLHCLGRLMGVCVRRGDVIPLSLSRVVWKLLVDDEPTLEDLACVDVAAAESVKSLLDIEALGIAPEEFEMYFGEMYFLSRNSSKTEVPLLEGGAQVKVTYETTKKYATLMMRMRLHEAQEQVDCIKSGMATVVPVGCFAMWSWRDLELRVCGNPKIDTKVLREHCNYEGCCETDPHVCHLWKVLDSMNQQDLQRFLRFVWGRSRLPPEGSSMWNDGFKIAAADDLVQTGLPRAHTCFFQIDLPRYETRQMCEERVLFAIRNCLSMQNA